MELKELGTEYLEQAKNIRKKIKNLRAQLPELKGAPLVTMQRKLLMLYCVANELTETGNYLKDYYEEGSRCDQKAAC
jgi:hypothetical protein